MYAHTSTVIPPQAGRFLSQPKTCRRCEKLKPSTDFVFSRGKKGQVRRSAYCKSCYAIKVEERRQKGLARSKINGKAWHRKLRLEVIRAYGGKCVCCGESRWEFLSIDHIDGNGAVERRMLGRRSGRLYRSLQQRGYPKENYQLLCYNCNFAKGHYGFCPHQKVSA